MNDHIHHAPPHFTMTIQRLRTGSSGPRPYQLMLRLTADLDTTEGRYDDVKKYETIAEAHGISVQSLHALAYCQFKTGNQRSENTYEQLLSSMQKMICSDNLQAVHRHGSTGE